MCFDAAMTLPIAQPWFRIRDAGDGLTQIDEPHVGPLLQANVWWLRGRDRDLVVDTGLGVGSLRTEVPGIAEADPVVVLTHGHLDHTGGAPEFDAVLAHPGDRVHDPLPGSLHRAALLDELLPGGAPANDDNPPLLVTAVPHTGYDPAAYRLRPPVAVYPVADGDVVDLGDRWFTVLHLPGHSPGTICLYEEATGTLFSGDCVYDDVLFDELVGSDVAAYVASMKRLLELDVHVVHPGHGDSFDGDRLREIGEEYLATRT
jgi:glyoxylase-like metal-dependent hydrolase (beta-lactamase superfamily II)